MDNFLFTAEFINDDFRITRYYILEETKDRFKTVTREGTSVTFTNEITQIAFSEKDAILILINNYNRKMDNAPSYQVELLYQQRKVQRIYHEKYLK